MDCVDGNCVIEKKRFALNADLSNGGRVPTACLAEDSSSKSCACLRLLRQGPPSYSTEGQEKEALEEHARKARESLGR